MKWNTATGIIIGIAVSILVFILGIFILACITEPTVSQEKRKVKVYNNQFMYKNGCRIIAKVDSGGRTIVDSVEYMEGQ